MGFSFAMYFSEFAESNPNWFDWFSLGISSLISIFSVWGGFVIAKRIYSTEKNDKLEEEKEIQDSEVRLFKNSLKQLNSSITHQISHLEEYLEEQNFSLKFNSGVQIDFMQFINVKYLYKDIGLENQEDINEINKLISTLYTLSDFRISLRDEFRTYMKKYNFHENKFYLYRKLMYTKYFELCNLRNIEVKLHEGVKLYKFDPADVFMAEYTQLRVKTFSDAEVISENGLKDRTLFNERFIVPLINITSKYLPEDYNAIEVNDIANDVNSAYIDMENVTSIHIRATKSYLKALRKAKTRIEDYLD